MTRWAGTAGGRGGASGATAHEATGEARDPAGTVSRLSVRDASKTFGTTKVLDGVSLDIAPGEVHAVLGENGSGKSTLIKLLSGFHEPDRGAVFSIDGERFGPPVRPWGWQRSRLAFVHQDLGLVEGLSVLDNVRLGRYERGRLTRKVKVRHERATVARSLAELGRPLDPDRLVSTLNFAERATVAITRALQTVDAARGCIVFDESTRSLPHDALGDFYGLVRQLVARGSSVLFVSHRLDEVIELADRATVLRDGQVVAEAAVTATTTESDLAASLVRRDAPRRTRRTGGATPLIGGGETAPALAAQALRGDRLRALDLVVGAGEVLGVTGTVESGYDEVPYLLAGARQGAGTVTVGARSIDLGSAGIEDLIAAGVRLVPEDRAAQGLALANSVLENLTLPVVDQRPRSFFVSPGRERQDFRAAVDAFHLRPARSDLPAGQLSGGNQQKLLLAKALLGAVRVLVVHEPTQGVDVGARRELLSALRGAAGRGAGVLVCSMESSDLAAVCDRVLVVRRGEPPAELPTPSAEEILDATYPHRATTGKGGPR